MADPAQLGNESTGTITHSRLNGSVGLSTGSDLTVAHSTMTEPAELASAATLTCRMVSDDTTGYLDTCP